MGVETGKESAGPIRRFPTGFWASFNLWWHSEFARHGQRPSSKAIGKWHSENAVKVWGEHAVSYTETQRHANRMKCRRTGLHLNRYASLDDDDDDDDFCPDSAPTTGVRERAGGGGGAVWAAAELDAIPVDPSTLLLSTSIAPEDCSGPQPADRSGSIGVKHEAHVNFDAHSDPPGALTGYMNADSDLPAPAAAPISEPLVLSFPGSHAHAQMGMRNGGAIPSWLQPDPTEVAPPGGRGPLGRPSGGGSGSGCAGGPSPLWDSAFSLLGPGPAYSNLPSCDAARLARDSSGGAAAVAPGPVWMSAKRLRDPRNEDGVTAGAELSLNSRLHCIATAAPLRSNPFAEVAAAAAAAAGLPAAKALPAARDAAALLNSAALAAPSLPSRLMTVPRLNAAWLRQVGSELDELMREMGLMTSDANALALPGVWAQPRMLDSTQPLRLPERAPCRHLDSLLRRGLLHQQQQQRQQQHAPASGAGGAGVGDGLCDAIMIDRVPLEVLL